jgi:hypothetical protein
VVMVKHYSDLVPTGTVQYVLARLGWKAR